MKHAFITRFNDLRSTVYRDYTIRLAYDMSQTREETAFSDPSDLVARRIGFIPLPLGVAMGRVLCTTVTPSSKPINILLFIIAYFTLVSLRVIISLFILGKATTLISIYKSSNIDEIFKKPVSKNSESSTLDMNNTNLLMPTFSNIAVSSDHIRLNNALLQSEDKIEAGVVEDSIEEIPVLPKNFIKADSEPVLFQCPINFT